MFCFQTQNTFTLTQKYKKLNRTRKLYFKDDYKIFKIEELNHNENDPDAYLRIDFHYFQNNCFDSLNKVLQLGLYTPIPEKKLITPVKYTIQDGREIIKNFKNNLKKVKKADVKIVTEIETEIATASASA